MFTNYWKEAYPTHHHTVTSPSIEPLMDDEKGAMWYVGGYFIKTLTQKVKSKVDSHPNYNIDLLSILESFQEAEVMVEDTQLDELKSKEWFNRGGLMCCTNDFYNFMINLEKEMKKVFQQWTFLQKRLNIRSTRRK